MAKRKSATPEERKTHALLAAAQIIDLLDAALKRGLGNDPRAVAYVARSHALAKAILRAIDDKDVSNADLDAVVEYGLNS